MSPTIDWEKMFVREGDTSRHMWRAQVFGGWLIKSLDETRTMSRERGRYETETRVDQVSMTFVPDPQHIWDTFDKLLKE